MALTSAPPHHQSVATAARERRAASAARAHRAPAPAVPRAAAPHTAAPAVWDPAAAAAADDALSSRHLELDPAGYFLVTADHTLGLLRVEHYPNSINAAGLACDPRTGEVIPCSGYTPPEPRTFEGLSAKALAVAILETPAGAGCVSRLEHAAYLGRELQRAEEALRRGSVYVQD